MTDIPESVNLSDVSSRKVDTELLNELRDLFARAENQKERYDFTWNGKAKAYFEAATPTTKTLRPQPEESYIYADDDYKEKVNTFNDSGNLFITGDNLEALKLLQESYLGKIDMIYIDPPYNTGNDLIYKNDFSKSEYEELIESGLIDDTGNRLAKNDPSSGRYHSSWLSLMFPRLKIARNLLTDDGILVITIDDFELPRLTLMMDEVFGENNRLGTVTVKNNPSGRSTTKGFSVSNEYALFYSKSSNTQIGRLPRNDSQLSRYKESDDLGKFEWTNFRKHGGFKEDAPTMYYPIYIKRDGSSFRIPNLQWNEERKAYDSLDDVLDDELISYPIDDIGRDRRWKWGLERARKSIQEMTVRLDKNKKFSVYIKSRMNEEGMLPLTIWDNTKYSATEYGTNHLKKLFNGKTFDYPKSFYAVEDSIRVASSKKDAIILDFFAGSATTGEAVMRLNSEDNGTRKFILVTLDEPISENSEPYQAGYQTIDQISRERIRRAAVKIGDKSGFRALKVDSTGLKENVFKTAGELDQADLLEDIDNHSDIRSDYDLIYDVLVDGALEYNRPITIETMNDEQLIKYDYLGELSGVVCYFGENLTDELTRQIATLKPLIAVFKESTFDKSAQKVNVMEQFRIISPDTKVKVI